MVDLAELQRRRSFKLGIQPTSRASVGVFAALRNEWAGEMKTRPRGLLSAAKESPCSAALWVTWGDGAGCEMQERPDHSSRVFSISHTANTPTTPLNHLLPVLIRYHSVGTLTVLDTTVAPLPVVSLYPFLLPLFDPLTRFVVHSRIIVALCLATFNTRAGISRCAGSGWVPCGAS